MNQTNWVGVDTHKETLACYKDGRFKEFKTTQKDFDAAIRWAGNDSKWAIEGAYCYGKPFTAHLVRNGCEVYEVDSLLTKTWRRSLAICNPKNDNGDAKVITQAINEIDKEIKKSLPEKAQRLKQLKGVGDLTAAIIYTETKFTRIISKLCSNCAG